MTEKKDSSRRIPMTGLRLDPDLKAEVKSYSDQRNLTFTDGIQALARKGISKPPTDKMLKALSNPLFAKRAEQLHPLDPKIAEGVAKEETELLAKVLNSEIADEGRQFQKRIESKGFTMNDFEDVAEAKLFLAFYDEYEEIPKEAKEEFHAANDNEKKKLSKKFKRKPVGIVISNQNLSKFVNNPSVQNDAA